MKKFGRFAKEIGLFLILLLVLSWGINRWRAPEHPIERFPEFPGRLLNGQTPASVLRPGTPVLVHFWGTWCPVCRLEAVNIDTVARHYPVLSIAVSSGSAQKIRQWMNEKGVNYPVLSDPRGILAERFGVTVFPTSFIYDARGKLRFVETGYTTTAGLLARLRLAQ